MKKLLDLIWYHPRTVQGHFTGDGEFYVAKRVSRIRALINKLNNS